MNTHDEEEIMQQLWSYADGTCTADMRSYVAQQLQQDPVWQRLFDGIQESQALLKGMEPDAPSLRFTQNVLDRVMALQPRPLWQLYVNKWFGRTMIALYVLPLLLLIAGIAILMRSAVTTGNSRLYELFSTQQIGRSAASYMAWFWVLPLLLLADAYSRYRRRLRAK